MSIDRDSAAYHEAAHAVVAMAQGMGVRSISTESIKEVVGKIELLDDGPLRTVREKLALGTKLASRDVLLVEQHVRASLAGEIAQNRFAPQSVAHLHPSSDMEALKLLNLVAGSERELEAWIDLLRIQSEQLVEQNWKSVEVIAKALVERPRLTGDEVVDVLGKACTNDKSASTPSKQGILIQAERRFCL